MGKKKFIHKKKSATFQLMARDSSDPYYSSDPSGDRVFVRVDNNQYAPGSSLNDGNPNVEDVEAGNDSIFADADEGSYESYVGNGNEAFLDDKHDKALLPDNIRKEILDLGFPDDGYNYLMHLREIKNVGAGSSYYQNPKAHLDYLPMDVKAYDASKIEVPKISSANFEDKALYNAASKTVSMRLNKALDPEVAAMLNDSDSSKFSSDVEFEDDFVVKANHMDTPIKEQTMQIDAADSCIVHQTAIPEASIENEKYAAGSDGAEKRIRRQLDEQFDMLELHEYRSEEEEEEECGGCFDVFEANDESLAEKLNHAFSGHHMPLKDKEGDDDELPELAAEVIRRCREYAEKYEGESHGEEEVLFEESSNESDIWDCETIVSTYSTLDNHPGKIGAPESRRRKKAAEGASDPPVQKITLKGKECMPVDFLPRRGKRGGEDMAKDAVKPAVSRKPRNEETKEEKKERKSAVKMERREARRQKKEMKVLYKSEGLYAQKVAAVSGPSSIHLV